MMPHVGVHEGVHYAMACNGSGVVTMTHLGKATAHQILGGGNRPSAFARLSFPTRPFYSGNPWFMPVVGTAYTVGTGGWLMLQAVRAKATPATLARMGAYMAIDTATGTVPIAGDIVVVAKFEDLHVSDTVSNVGGNTTATAMRVDPINFPIPMVP